VQLVEVDPVGPKPAQRRRDRAADERRRAATAGIHRPAELRREDDLVAPPLDRAADELLAPAVAVDVRGVEEGHALLERGVDHRARGVLVDPTSEVVATEPDDRDLERADAPRLHGAHPIRGVSAVRVGTRAASAASRRTP